jgi:hypothetical protein
MIIVLVYAVTLLVVVVLLLWFLIPALYGLPPVPTRPERIRKALHLAALKPADVLYDLGAGDGRVLFMAAREFGARAVGIEAGPIQCALIWLRTLGLGLGSQVKVRWENFYKAYLHDADVVFVYATSMEIQKLAPHLERQLKRGTRLVSIAADFPEWEPYAFDERDLIFLYEMPPTRGSLTSYWLKNAVDQKSD